MGPENKSDPLYLLLRDNMVQDFNRRRAAGETCDLANGDFRGCDLRGLEANGLNLAGAYFRRTDLRGIDFSKANLEGASINGARISGCLFPIELSPEEIDLAASRGIRMRYRR
jgi:uncharacterized protein YjbI with pentapeptide repeats